MGLETGNYINDLNVANPASGDQKSEGDDHFRLIKTVVKQTFPGLAGRAWREQSKAANYTVLATDNMSAIRFTAGYTLDLTAAASLGNGWCCLVQGDAAVTVDPDGAETVNGGATAMIPVGYIGFLYCTGSAWFLLVAPKSYSAAVLSVLDDASLAAMRTTLQLNHYRLISQTVYTSGSGTHTYDARTTLRRARLVGGGGGGGGCDGQGAGTSAAGGGGGAGGYVEDLSDPAATEAYAVGAAGTAGAAAAGNGGTGGNTTLGSLTGSGGNGGDGITGGSNTSNSLGGVGGAATGGNTANVPGQTGRPGRRISGVGATNGDGGSTGGGLGVGGVKNFSSASGNSGLGYGAGGSGAYTADDATNLAGGAGAAGLIIIEEYTND